MMDASPAAARTSSPNPPMPFPASPKRRRTDRLTIDEENALLRAAKRNDQRAVAELIERHAGLVQAEVRRHLWTGLSAEDLSGEGLLGLLESIRRFDTTRRTRLSTYAVWWIRASIWDFVWKNRRIVPIPSTRRARRIRVSIWRTERALTGSLGRPPTTAELADALAVDEQDVLDLRAALTGRDVILGGGDDEPSFELPSTGASPEEILCESDTRRAIQDCLAVALERLPARERTIVERRLLSEEGPTLTALGEELGVSRERVRQLQKRAERTLRDALSAVA
ncbi:MAG: sigma-70 family RNA polymerase sigma factor [Myxococcota bacterium]